jgi:hypothetical protein
MSDKKRALPDASAPTNDPSAAWRDKLILVDPNSLRDSPEPLHEPYFADVALDMLRHKWIPFPQQRAESRKPSVIDGRTLRYSLFKEAPPSEKDVRWWSIQAAQENCAVMMWPPSGGPFGLDKDITDPKLAAVVSRLAREMLGETPFRRIGNAPKSAWIYRSDPSDPIRTKRDIKIVDGEGKPTGHAIEVLANGSPLTVAGRHYRTQKRFQWESLVRPYNACPDQAPLVTATQLQAFFEGLDELLAKGVDGKVYRLTGVKKFDTTGPRVAQGSISPVRVDASGVVVPGNRERTPGVTFAGGLVVDNREIYIRSRAVHYVLCNRALAESEAGRHALTGALWSECREVFDGLGQRFTMWGTEGDDYGSDTSVLAACRNRMESAKDFVDHSPDLQKRIGREENGAVNRVIRSTITVDRGADDALAWLDAGEFGLVRSSSEDKDRKRVERALVLDEEVRHAGQDKVSARIKETARRFVAQVREYGADPEAEFKVIILKAPTGAGKTSSMADELNRAMKDGPFGPVLFLLPSYANIDEVVARARNPKTVKEAAASTTFRGALKEAMGELKGSKLKVGVLTGKERGGCFMNEHLAFLRKHGQPASSLCHAKVQGPFDDEPQDKFCQHHPERGGSCPVILARQELAEKDVIFAPTAFHTTQLPAGLKGKIRGLIIDERCIFEMMRWDMLPLDVLLQGRPEPSLLKKEREEGLTPEELMWARDDVARMAHDALVRGECPAAAIFAFRQEMPNGRVVTGADLVESAITVTGRAQRVAAQIVPDMKIEMLQHLFAGPKAEHLRQEYRFWSIIKERLAALLADKVLRELAAAAGNEVAPALLQARDERELRIQLLQDGVVPGTDKPMIRLSWLDEPNLPDVPTLLLDASADPEMIAKCWSGRGVETVDVPAYLHLRTVVCMDSTHATSTFLPGLTEDPVEKEKRARKLKTLRRAVNNVAHVEGYSRIAVYGPQKIRKAYMDRYGEAPNVDLGHYGAIRGLDYARLHQAVVTIGRHAFPTFIIDALAACLAYNDLTPEHPYDAAGTGKDENGEVLLPPKVDRVYKLRDGRDLTVEVTEYPGYWARKVERQFREEEQRQAMGRLRPVYRDEIGTWIAISKILPEDTIIDAVTTLDTLADLNKAGAVFEAVRRIGVVDQELLSRLAPDAAPAGGFGEVLARKGLGGADVSGPLAKGMDVYRVKVDGETRAVQVPGYDRDPVQTIIERFDAIGRTVQGATLVAEGATKIPSQAKTADKVDLEMGSREERLAQEEEARQAEKGRVKKALTDEWHRPFGADAPMLVEPEAVDVEVRVILTSQGGLTPVEAEKADATDSRPTAPSAAAVPASTSGPQSSTPEPILLPEPRPVHFVGRLQPAAPRTLKLAPGLRARSEPPRA